MNAPERIPRDGESYYGQPAVKPSLWGARVALYTFLGGLAGAAQAIAMLARATTKASPRLARNANRIGVVVGAGIGPALLVWDLHTPKRWYNMLRIFRPTSPMSIGTYVLSGFAGSSLLAAFGAKSMQAPAAALGAGMATYTPALLGSTATPLWSATPRLLAAEFATSAFASGAAALSIFGGREDRRALDHVALAGVLAHAALTAAAMSEHRREGVERPLEQGRWAAMHKAGLAIGVALPAACYAMSLLGRPSRRLSVLGGAGVCIGGFLTRWALFGAGNESARDPREYLRLRGGAR